MDKKYSISEEDGITKIKYLKTPTCEGIKAIVDDIAENYSYRLRLYDMSTVSFDLPNEELKICSEYGKLKFPKPNRIAIYANDDLAFGEMRIFEVYREEEGRTPCRVFRTEKEAIEWLKS